VICYAFIFVGLSLPHIPVHELVNLAETYLVFLKLIFLFYSLALNYWLLSFIVFFFTFIYARLFRVWISQIYTC
jgi:hypothetical protein